MKNILLIATSAILIAGAAQADVEFVKGEVSASWTQFDGEDWGIIDADASAAFSMGTYGFQFGGTRTTYTDFTDSDTFGGSNGHIYHQGANGNKYGAYYSSFVPGLSSYGLEGMFNLGPIDVEAYYGIFEDEDIAQFGVDVYYNVNSDIEISAGYFTIFETGGTSYMEIFALGATYDIPNTNVAATVSYESFDSGSESMYGIGFKWSFGPNQSERLFGDRNFSLI